MAQKMYYDSSCTSEYSSSVIYIDLGYCVHNGEDYEEEEDVHAIFTCTSEKMGSDSNDNTGAIVGGVFGALAGTALLGGGIYFGLKKYKECKKSKDNDKFGVEGGFDIAPHSGQRHSDNEVPVAMPAPASIAMQPRGSVSDGGFKSYDNPLGNEDPLGPDEVGIDLAVEMNNAKKKQGQEKAAPGNPPDNSSSDEDPLGPDEVGIDLAAEMNNAKDKQGQEKAAPGNPPDTSSSDEVAAIPAAIKQQIQAQSAASLRNMYTSQSDAPPPATSAKPLAAYTVMDVCEFVKKIGLPSDTFEENEVNGILLSELTMEDLTNDLQLKRLHAKKLMRALGEQYPDRRSS
ncbi:hypothetical protein CYMTET_45892 [Cymbomonas tetramitiformis]|uniref:SAM domain-containing protein n=1 Tax=Cymbomonas tetramitiformis TaxID=36881 RepID=A0AAE0BXB0_9CHLO|nr:hypothetical protein CYMTET_45892 [Cymbomonas tetramitiformis]